MRSLPNDVNNYILLHASGDGYTDYPTVALKYEQQQRLFQEIEVYGSLRQVHALEKDGSWEDYNDY